jgi:hypothetical protein
VRPGADLDVREKKKGQEHWFEGLNGVMRNSEQGICLICSKEEAWSRMLGCEGERFGGTGFWKRGLGTSMSK